MIQGLQHVSKELTKRLEEITISARQKFLDDLEQFYRVNIKRPITKYKRLIKESIPDEDEEDSKWTYAQDVKMVDRGKG